MFDDPLALLEVIPMHTGIAEVELFLAVAENFAQARVMEQQATVLIDDQKRRWTKIEYLAELAFVPAASCPRATPWLSAKLVSEIMRPP